MNIHNLLIRFGNCCMMFLSDYVDKIYVQSAPQDNRHSAPLVVDTLDSNQVTQ